MAKGKIRDINIERPVLVKNKVQEVQDFLEENYQIMVNRFDPSKTIIRSINRKYAHPITFDDISLHLIEEDINHSDTLLRKILRSPNRVDTYDPIKEYFDNLKGKFHGVSHIDLLASHIKCREYSGWPRDYFQKRMYKYLKKWLVAAAACALEIQPNDVALGLIHSEEGIGKSFFINYLVPEALKPHISNPNPDEDKKFNITDSFARNFLVLFDELVGIKRHRPESLMKLLSDRQVDVFLPREPFPVTVSRIANAAFTSNRIPEKGGFLTNAMGYRRWFVIELESINQSYSSKVDVDQIWAEALMLMDQEFDYTWRMEDFLEFKKVNQLYREETAADKYVKMYFKKPLNGEGDWMQPQEILEFFINNRMLRSDDKGNVNNENIGRALTRMGYEHKKIRRGHETPYCYRVMHV